jgi:hypothetical protein
MFISRRCCRDVPADLTVLQSEDSEVGMKAKNLETRRGHPRPFSKYSY